MNSYIDIKYVNLIAPKLQQFKKRGEFLWNFRCYVCGDSQKSRTKARGYIFRQKNDLFFKCHNCGVSTTFMNLMKQIDFQLYNDYKLEKYKNNNVKVLFDRNRAIALDSNIISKIKFSEPVFIKKDIFKNLKSIASLPKTHPAKLIIQKRCLPEKALSDLFYCDSFYNFTNTLIPNKFPPNAIDHPRLIIPFRDIDGEVFVYQGRAFGQEQPKYITIKLNPERDKIFGLDKVHIDDPINIVEGPLDSLFLDNCIAVGGSSLSNPLIIDDHSIENNHITIIFDNEPRNREICKAIEKNIDIGRNVVLWPQSVKEKDINDMILSGRTIEEIKEIIYTNVFCGPKAKLQFSRWRKINAQ
tara:strand:- start:2152 stop:3219 length:1068 start_codon:yes stop_codon:yes gene_type:complete